MSQISQSFCSHCGKYVPVSKNTPNHTLHFLVSLFSCGLWVIPWVLISAFNGSAKWRCNHCGSSCAEVTIEEVKKQISKMESNKRG
jgi:hypothetical protein